MRRGATHPGSRRSGRRWLVLSMLLAWGVVARAQTAQTPAGTAAPEVPALPAGATPSVAQSQSPATKVVAPSLPAMPAAQGDEVDRVVAIVNGQLILDSDVDRERRFAALLPYGEASGPYNREAAIERLINRDLILQQVELQPGDVITVQAARKDLDALRKSIPACERYHCETEEGWKQFLATEGFTDERLTELWRQRMEVLAFIELRFRMGVRVTQRGHPGVLHEDAAAGVCGAACEGAARERDRKPDPGGAAAAEGVEAAG